jgi:putative hemin transport protein
MTPTPPDPSAPSLAARVETLRTEEPRLRDRDLAARLGVTEADLLDLRVGAGVTRLVPDWDALLAGLPTLGHVMALTRNATVVHERRGTYGAPEGQGHVRLVLGPDIDLRLFVGQWRAAYAIDAGGRRSVQVFDGHGDAVHKVHLVEGSDGEAFEALVHALATEVPAPARTPRPPRAAERPDDEIDVPGFRAGWAALTDTHDFFGLLRRFGVTRSQALRLAPPGFADPLSTDALAEALGRSADAGLPIMAFVGNPGCIQIHTGPVHRVVPTGGWLNVLDPAFNLHVRADRIAACWRVHKPTLDGVVTSLEVFDVDDELCVQLFGARKPGKAQDVGWERIVGAIV